MPSAKMPSPWYTAALHFGLSALLLCSLGWHEDLGFLPSISNLFKSSIPAVPAVLLDSVEISVRISLVAYGNHLEGNRGGNQLETHNEGETPCYLPRGGRRE